jgi:hypothetical protein
MLALPVFGDDWDGGLFASRTQRPRRLFGVLPMRHDRGLALVYASVLGTWVFAAADAVARPRYAAAAGTFAAAVFYVEFERQDGTLKRLRKHWGKPPLTDDEQCEAWNTIEQTDAADGERSDPELLAAADALVRQLKWEYARRQDSTFERFRKRRGRPPLTGGEQRDACNRIKQAAAADGERSDPEVLAAARARAPSGMGSCAQQQLSRKSVALHSGSGHKAAHEVPAPRHPGHQSGGGTVSRMANAALIRSRIGVRSSKTAS